MWVFRRCGGAKGTAYLLINRQKIVVYALALAKAAVFLGLLSHVIGGQMSSNPLLFGRYC